MVRLADSAKETSPSLVMPVNVRAEMAAVPGVGDGLIMSEPESKFPPSGTLGIFEWPLPLLLVSDVEREPVEESPLLDVQDVELALERLLLDVEFESAEASLLRDAEAEASDVDVELDDVLVSEPEIESDGTAVDNFCSFRGGSPAHKTTAAVIVFQSNLMKDKTKMIC